MEGIVLPCKTIPFKIPEIPQNPAKSTISYPIISKKSTDDAHLLQLCNNGRLDEAIHSLDSIAQCGSTVRHSTLSHLIDSCIESDSLKLCNKLHAHVRNSLKHEPDPFLETKLVSMFAKCGSLDDAFKVFDGMSVRNLYAWSAVIGACSREKKWNDVVKLFYSMMIDGNIVPDNFLFPKILQACANCGDFETGKLIHAMVIKSGMNKELRVNNSIVSVYAKCGQLNYAEKFFEAMEVNDVVSWNAMITGYCQKGKLNEALRLFHLMREKGVEPGTITWNIMISSCTQLGKCDDAMKMMNEMESCGIEPDVFTWTSIILGFAQNNRRLEALKLFGDMLLAGVEPNGVTLMSAISTCSSLKDLRKGKELHLLAIKLGYGEDVLVGNSLIDMYSKCNKLQAARQAFDSIQERDVYSWNSMISGYCQSGYCDIAQDLFNKMRESNIRPNVITWNVMITGYIQNGDENQAMDLFNRMEKDGGIKRDTASWNALIAGYLHHGSKNKALGILRQMQSFGVKPNSVTILSILPACANLIASKKLKEIHGRVIRSNLACEGAVTNSLIDTYAKSGNIRYSEIIFNGFLSKDIVTWNKMMASYVLHGFSGKCIELFELMKKEGLKPNRGTFVSLILAHAKAKMVDEGSCVFSSVTEDYQILPGLDHYLAMVNLYGRSGKIDEAFKFIQEIIIEPDVAIWAAFLTACQKNGNVKMAIYAGEQILELEPENLTTQKLVLHLYGLSGISKDSSTIKKPGERKDPNEPLGQSWIEDKNTVHTFVAGNCSDSSTLSWIKKIGLKSQASEYCDDLSIEVDEKEESGGIHSEKLALAFTLINSPKSRGTIKIFKNVRMCENCHGFAKVVSEIHGCEIYLSDTKCLHHFKNGKCSCGDYW